jgi:DNA modification methylase
MEEIPLADRHLPNLAWSALFYGGVIMKVSEIIFREDLYPRFEPNHQAIQRYSEAIEYLPPIKINQNNILIDGFHRWKAHKLIKSEDIKVEITKTSSEQELKIMAYRLNSVHGLQLTLDEKKKFAREMYGVISEQEIANTISVGKSSVYNWTTTQRENAQKELERKALEMYLRAWNTQESIAEELGVTQQTVSNILTKNSTDVKISKDFKPYLYNIWNLHKAEKDTSHFGHFPQIFMDNLLYYHTQPWDIIYDPFAGDGTTVDSCKDMFRRYYCSDKNVKPGRERDIRQWDVTEGLPSDLRKPDLLFLDPPYWKLAKKEYSEDASDLGNMTFEKFKETINNFVAFLVNKKVIHIAYLIRPIYDDGFEWRDPIFELHEALKNKYQIENRYVIPYSTQQYSALWVDRAKKANKCLILNRELVVWRCHG